MLAFCLSDDSHNDLPKYSAGLNKYKRAKVGVLCICVDWIVDGEDSCCIFVWIGLLMVKIHVVFCVDWIVDREDTCCVFVWFGLLMVKIHVVFLCELDC